MKKKLDIIEKIKQEKILKKPHLYKLILLNDDFTTMEFVVKILIMFLNKNKIQAISLMMKIHIEDSAVCGLFTLDIAKTIKTKINNYSNLNQQPLKCIIRI
tara:strand:- start:3040 stop:3342 length:303 start_codon:yes stop_codon:yes gene_type:complete